MGLWLHAIKLDLSSFRDCPNGLELSKRLSSVRANICSDENFEFGGPYLNSLVVHPSRSETDYPLLEFSDKVQIQ